MKVYDVLKYGRENAILSKVLAQALGFGSVRELQKAVEAERAAGAVILCASDGAGYYLSDDPVELRRFTRTLNARAANTLRVAESAQRALDVATGQERMAGWLMADIPYVCLYASYLDGLSPFTDTECGRLVRAMLNYAATGEAPQFEGNERFIWPSLQAQIDRDIETYQAKCARNKANGSKGGRPPEKPTVLPETERFLEKPQKPKEKEKDNIGADKPPTRHKYGSYKNVLFTDEEYAKLQAEYPADYSERIERLSEYIASTGKSYKSHLATIRSWARKDGAKVGEMPNYGGEENWSL